MKKTIPLLAILMAELCLATPLVTATARTATESFVTNRIAAAISQIPEPDFSTNNAALVETIEATAPAPGNYAAVSNAAVHAAITNALQDAAIDGKLDKSGGTMTGTIYFGAQGIYGYMGLAYDGKNHRLVITDGWHENMAYLEVPNAYDGDRVAFTHDIPTVPTNVSAFNNDAGYLTGYTESDPTVPQWAKASTKPTYTAAEVGAVSTAGGTLTGPLTLTRGIAAGRDAMFYGDGMKNLDNNAVYAWPTKSGTHHFALTSDIPDVPAWALAAQKPTYTADEVGAYSTNETMNIVSVAISPTSPAFSNAVLSVGLGIDTNTVAVINELVDSSHDLPVSGATSVGALLLALAAAVAALKKNLRYSYNTATVSSGTTPTVTDVADRAINTATLGSSVTAATVTLPAATTGRARDFFIDLTIEATTAPTLTFIDPATGTTANVIFGADSLADIDTGKNAVLFTEFPNYTWIVSVKHEEVTA